MQSFYITAVVLLFIFAVVDLFVGVSNDAVNFLNSAIGSRVASRRIILSVASVGIFAGAVLSTGMMEVVRKGIFNPAHFYLSEITVILTAVMLADILLLDFFNTIGMPTSTTVSVVFELFGAAVFVSVLKLIGAGEGIDQLGQYINTGKALVIISGILLSVVVAFAVGAFVQYFSRIVFSFHYEKRYRFAGVLWAGLAVTAMCYFLLYKGMKGTYKIIDQKELAHITSGKTPDERMENGRKTWVVDRVAYRELQQPDGRPEYITGSLALYRATRWVRAHFILVLIGLLLFWSVVMSILIALKIDMLRAVVLFGTFCLAMAFAGNDLVNFIGVPIAGYQSYHLWSASGLPADAYSMAALSHSVPTPLSFLALAALVMILTLWLSKKARSVTDTEVNLARQNEAEERFSPNAAAQNIVKSIRRLGQGLFRLFPKRFLVGIEQNFKPSAHRDPTVAFDLVRASVNLTVASILIALATSYKLPLSTTYVSFMVAMGTSLSDRAWDRESAVYRVSGVMQVISGWFLTAFIAFFTAGLFAVLIYYLHIWAMLGLTAIAFFALYQSAIFHRRKAAHEQQLQAVVHGVDGLTISLAIESATENISSYATSVGAGYALSISGLFEEREKDLKKAHKKLKALEQDFDVIHNGIYRWIKRARTDDPTAGSLYIEVYDHFSAVIQSVRAISNTCYEHVKNSHKPLKGKQKHKLNQIKTAFADYVKSMQCALQNWNANDLSTLTDRRKKLVTLIHDQIEEQVLGMTKGKYGIKNSHTNLGILLNTRRAILSLHDLVHAFQSVQKRIPPTAEPQ